MKQKFKHIYLACITVILLSVVSCEDLKFGNDFLQKPPSSDVTIDTVFTTAEYARRVLWYSYESMPYGIPTKGYKTAIWLSTFEGLSDLCQESIYYSSINTLYYNGMYNAKSEDSTWPPTKCSYYDNYHRWTSIRNAWLVVQNINMVEDMDDSEKARLKAEAKTLIAVLYTELLRNFGGLPIVDHVIAPEDQMGGRATVEETVNFIVRILDEAIAEEDFPWALPTNERVNWEGRLTKASAMALKARVLLFAASPLFNSNEPYYPGEAADKHMSWYGNYDKARWKDAMDACKDFFDKLAQEGFYKMVEKEEAASVYTGYKNEYRYAFRAGYFDRGTTESLISVHRNHYKVDGSMLLDQSIRWGDFCPTKEYFDMFQMADGSDFDWNNPEHAKHPFANREPRFYETIFADGDAIKGRKAELTQAKPGDAENYPKGKDWGQHPMTTKSLLTGIAARKWGLDRGGELFGHIIQWPYLRLPEIYLSYAEAINEYNGGPTAEAYKYVDAVRARVGMKGLKKGLSQEEFRNAVLRERACEFGWESIRYFDLIRWKMEKNFSTELHGLNIYKNKNTREYECEPFTLKGTKGSRAWWNEGGFSGKWYMSAFPSNEVNKGYGIIQNPGWE